MEECPSGHQPSVVPCDATKQYRPTSLIYDGQSGMLINAVVCFKETRQRRWLRWDGCGGPALPHPRLTPDGDLVDSTSNLLNLIRNSFVGIWNSTEISFPSRMFAN